jgi:hypothetical protein
MANLQKNEKNVLYKNAKKMRFHDSAEHAANPMQKNANEKCKSTPNIKLLTKKCKSDMQIYRNKNKKKPFTFNIPVSTKQILITSSTVHPGLKQLPPNKTTRSA